MIITRGVIVSKRDQNRISCICTTMAEQYSSSSSTSSSSTLLLLATNVVTVGCVI